MGEYRFALGRGPLAFEFGSRLAPVWEKGTVQAASPEGAGSRRPRSTAPIPPTVTVRSFSRPAARSSYRGHESLQPSLICRSRQISPARDARDRCGEDPPGHNGGPPNGTGEVWPLPGPLQAGSGAGTYSCGHGGHCSRISSRRHPSRSWKSTPRGTPRADRRFSPRVRRRRSALGQRMADHSSGHNSSRVPGRSRRHAR